MIEKFCKNRISKIFEIDPYEKISIFPDFQSETKISRSGFQVVF